MSEPGEMKGRDTEVFQSSRDSEIKAILKLGGRQWPEEATVAVGRVGKAFYVPSLAERKEPVDHRYSLLRQQYSAPKGMQGQWSRG